MQKDKAGKKGTGDGANAAKKRMFLRRIFSKPAEPSMMGAGALGVAQQDEPVDLNDREIALRDAFEKFDFDKDGILDKDDLRQALQEYLHLADPPTDAQISKIFRTIDINGHGEVSYNDFKHFMNGKNPPVGSKSGKVDYLYIFKTFDKDGDGFITKEELGAVLQDVNSDMRDDEVEQIFKSMDTDKDGRVSYMEFMQYFQ